MNLDRKWFLGICFGIILILTMFSFSSASTGEYLVFSQQVGAEEHLCVAKSDGSDLQTIFSGKDYTVFFLGAYLFYFQDQQLFDYDFTAKSSRFLTRFNKEQILLLQTLTDNPGNPEQVLIVTQNEAMKLELWYILDLSDRSLRNITKPLLPANQTGLIRKYSPDGSYLAKIHGGFNHRFGLEIQSSGRGKQKVKNLWTLPKKMTVLPEAPVWAPNSDMFAFYGKEFQDNPAGFYDLFLYDLTRGQIITIQEQVFNTGALTPLQMGEFTPDWSGDGKQLIVEYQPYGLPTESSILKYDAVTGKKTYLAEGPGTKGYPLWSPSGQAILFLSKQKGEGDQLFTMDDQGQNLIRVSPQEGITQWAGWYKPRSE